MSHETQPPSDDALKAHAAERRRALGTPPAMPDHVRTRLHREVRRVSAAAAVGPSRPAWWIWCLRPWAWGVAAALLAGIWITWQVLGPRPGEVRLVAARPKPTPSPSFEPRPEAAAVPTSPTSVPGTMLDSSAVSAREVQLSRAEATAAPAPVAPSMTRAVVPVAETEQRIETVEAQERARYALPPAVTRVTVPQPAPGADPDRVAAAPNASGPPERLVAGFRGATMQSQVQQRFRQNRPATSTPVLNSFQIDQVGRQLRLVDADGSVYLATLGAGTAGAGGEAAPSDAVATPSAGRGAPGQDRSQLALAAAPGGLHDGVPPMQVLTLSATGTNRQLRQQVVFAGNLLVTNLAGVPVVSEAAGIGTNVESLNQLFRNCTVNGLVTVGGTNEYAVEAVPAAP